MKAEETEERLRDKVPDLRTFMKIHNKNIAYDSV